MPSARNVAVKLLLRVEKGAYSNIILDNERSLSDLSDTDKKFTSRLFYGKNKKNPQPYVAEDR